MGKPEHQLQAAVVEWADLMTYQLPELALLYAVPNGGFRPAFTAKLMKAEGQKAGIPDMHLPVARGKYHSLYLEHKVGNNTLTPAQEWWKERLRAEGHAYCLSRSFETSVDVLTRYLRLPKALLVLGSVEANSAGNHCQEGSCGPEPAR